MATIIISGDASHILRNEFIKYFGFNDIIHGAKFAFAFAVVKNLQPVTEKTESGQPLTWSSDMVEPLVNVLKIVRSENNLNLTDDELLNRVRDLIHAGVYEIEKLRKENPKLTVLDLLSLE